MRGLVVIMSDNLPKGFNSSQNTVVKRLKKISVSTRNGKQLSVEPCSISCRIFSKKFQPVDSTLLS